MSDPAQIPPAAETLESQGAEDVRSNEDLTAGGSGRPALGRLRADRDRDRPLRDDGGAGAADPAGGLRDLRRRRHRPGAGGDDADGRRRRRPRPAPLDQRDHLRSGLALSCAIGVVLTAITVGLALLVIEPLFGQRTEMLTIATTPCFLLGAVYAVPMAVLRRRLDFRRLSIVDLSLNATRGLATLALALVGLDAPALVFGSMIGHRRGGRPGPLLRSGAAAPLAAAGGAGPASLRRAGGPGDDLLDRLPQRRLRGDRLGPGAGPGGLLLARLHARRRIPGQDRQRRRPDRLPGAVADGGCRGDAGAAPADGPPARRRSSSRCWRCSCCSPRWSSPGSSGRPGSRR